MKSNELKKVKIIVNSNVCNYDYYIRNGLKDGQEVEVMFMGEYFGAGNFYRLQGAPYFLQPDIDFHFA